MKNIINLLLLLVLSQNLNGSIYSEIKIVEEIEYSYKSLLNREPSEKEKEYWIDMISSKTSTYKDMNDNLMSAKMIIEKSNQFMIEDKIKKAYKNIFKEEINKEDLKLHYDSIVYKNKLLEDIEVDLKQNDKNNDIYLETHVRAVFLKLFNKQPNKKELSFWLNKLSNKEFDVSQLSKNILKDLEDKKTIKRNSLVIKVKGLYDFILKREPNKKRVEFIYQPIRIR